MAAGILGKATVQGITCLTGSQEFMDGIVNAFLAPCRTMMIWWRQRRKIYGQRMVQEQNTRQIVRAGEGSAHAWQAQANVA
jgi:hypothetical protein